MSIRQFTEHDGTIWELIDSPLGGDPYASLRYKCKTCDHIIYVKEYIIRYIARGEACANDWLKDILKHDCNNRVIRAVLE